MTANSSIPTGRIGNLGPVNPIRRICDQNRTGDSTRNFDFHYADQLGSTDDCGFPPVSGDISMTRQKADAKVRARLLGTEVGSQVLGGV
jgi:hypothetical protein